MCTVYVFAAKHLHSKWRPKQILHIGNLLGAIAGINRGLSMNIACALKCVCLTKANTGLCTESESVPACRPVLSTYVLSSSKITVAVARLNVT